MAVTFQYELKIGQFFLSWVEENSTSVVRKIQIA
jgi:hypothetical protein